MSSLPPLGEDAREHATWPLVGETRVALDAIMGHVAAANLTTVKVQRVPGAVKLETRLSWFDVEVLIEADSKSVRLSSRQIPRDPREVGKILGGMVGGVGAALGFLGLFVVGSGFVRGSRSMLLVLVIAFVFGTGGAWLGTRLGSVFALPFTGIKALVLGGPGQSRDQGEALVQSIVPVVEEALEALGQRREGSEPREPGDRRSERS